MRYSSIDGQISIFDILPPPEPVKTVKPGEWLEEDSLGDEMTFDDITKSVGDIIVLSKHTQNHKWYKAMLLCSILMAFIRIRQGSVVFLNITMIIAWALLILIYLLSPATWLEFVLTLVAFCWNILINIQML